MSHNSIIILTLIFSVWNLSYNIVNLSSVASEKCDSGNRTKLYFGPTIKNHVPFVIESSSRASHQIVSYILKELLTEYLCYQNVIVRVRDNNRDIQNIEDIQRSFRPRNMSCGQKLKSECFPEAMVNLEVWQPVGYPLIAINEKRNSYISDAGYLGSVVSPGFFVPESVANAIWKESRHKIVVDDWRLFQMLNYSQWFRSDLKGKTYETTRCNLKDKCARLLVGDSLRQNFLSPVSKYINATGLWISPQVIRSSSAIDRFLRESNKSLARPYPLLLHWHPSSFTLKYKLIRITSGSNQWAGNDPSRQILQEKRVHKWMWRNLSTLAPYAASTILRMNLSQEDYVTLLRTAASSDESVPATKRYQSIASEWIRNNAKKWEHWLPNIPKKTTFTVAGLFPPDLFFKEYITAVHKAVAFVNKNTLINSTFRLELEAYFVSRDAGSVLFAYNNMIFKCRKQRHLVGIIASTPSDVTIPLAHLSDRYKTVVVSPTVESLSNSKEEANKSYHYFFRTSPDHSDYSEYLISMFRYFKWRRVALFRQNGLIVSKQSLSYLTVVNDFKMDESLLTMEIVKNALSKADKKNRARIMVIDYRQHGTALFICAAVQLNMVPERGYVWLFPSWLESIEDPALVNRTTQNGCSANETRSIKTFFVLSPHASNPAVTKKILHLLLNLSTEVNKMNLRYPYYYTYDAFLVIAEALKALIDDNGDGMERFIYEEKEKYVEKLSKVKCFGAGTDLSFTSKNIRSSTQWVLYQHVVVPEANKFMKFVSLRWEKKNDSKRVRNMIPSKILLLLDMFLGDKMPNDGSTEEKCKWPFFARHLNKSCEYSRHLSIGLIVAGVVLFVLLLFLGVYFCSRWYIKRVNARCPQPFSELQEFLKDCEIPRTTLLLQYPLGEGAFGTVYYGEMKIDNIWTGIAAKVLREGASSDERREFLFEAIKMRDFDHPNVMTIIGVVTSVPNYVNVMEFMLLGDLRKYLLTRHHVAKDTPDHEDICPLTLTSMAHDIARGLEYLQQKRLVHRDLACRNCLIDKQRRIKIGDFGMTRRVDDTKGYYRFDRPGILPVRWMAPESIQSGIFNFYTDVWSYGVVLYEIVTFGNQPYRGRTNEEVIESMKHCNDSLANYLVKPEDRIPGLYDLMLSCWSFRAEERPAISFVIQRFEVNLDCVRPCLEEEPPHPGEARLPRGPNAADRIGSVFSAGDLPLGRGARGSGMCGMGSTASSDRTRVASGNRASTDMRHCDSVGRVNNLTANSFTNSIASRLGLIRDNSGSRWHAGGSNSNPKRHTCSQEFLSFSRHHSGDQEISTVSDPHGYQMEYDPLVLSSTARTFAANSCNSGYGGLPNEVHRDGERRSSSGGPRDDDDVDADQQTLLKMSRP